MERTITVTGRGAIHVVPDVTSLEVYISGRFETYQAAYDQAKENFAQLIKILEYNNKPGTLAKTIRMDISDFEKSITDKYGHHMYSAKSSKGASKSDDIPTFPLSAPYWETRSPYTND